MNNLFTLLRTKLANLIGGRAYQDQLQDLQTTSERYSLLTENISAALAIHSVNGKISFCSPYIEVLTGYSRKEVYQAETNFFEKIAHIDDQQKVGRSVKVSQYGEAFQFRFRYYHRTGMLMWAESRIVPIVDELGIVTSILSITIDVTAAVSYQHRVEEHNQDLQDFAYMISHDLKSPLVTVRGMLNTFLADYANQINKDGNDLLQHALKATDRLDLLVKSVLNYAQLSELEQRSEAIDLNQLIQEIINERKNILEQHSAQVTIDQLYAVNADLTMLYQICANLIDNAIKYRSPERTLLLHIYASENEKTKQQCINFSDNGLGIPAHKLGEIFRPFQRAHSKEIEGSGIGLAAVKKLTERLGGEVSVHSVENQGSIFSVTLPLH